jgi:hypothetical protein
MPEVTAMPTTPNALPTQENIIQSPAAPPAESEPTNTLPDEVLQIPTVYALLHGAPPAVYAPKQAQDPAIDIIVKNAKPLQEAGFAFYQSKDGKNTVLFNTAYVSPESIKKTDSEGKLTKDIPSFEDLKTKVDSAISGNPPEQGAALPSAPIASASSGPPPSSRTQNTLATARVRNLQVGAPTSGPVPGGGRVLSNILKTTI